MALLVILNNLSKISITPTWSVLAHCFKSLLHTKPPKFALTRPVASLDPQINLISSTILLYRSPL